MTLNLRPYSTFPLNKNKIDLKIQLYCFNNNNKKKQTKKEKKKKKEN